MAIALKLTVKKAEPLLRGQEHFWRVIRTMGGDGRSFSAADIAAVSQETHPATITSYLRRLAADGWIAPADEGPRGRRGHPSVAWRLTKEAPEEPPVISREGRVRSPITAQQAMWNVMRGALGRGGFSFRDLVAYGSTEDLMIPAETARTFLKRLAAAGYLVQLRPGGAARPSLWRLRPAMNTGPRPPMILRAHVVYDVNRERVAGDVIAEEEQP